MNNRSPATSAVLSRFRLWTHGGVLLMRPGGTAADADAHAYRKNGLERNLDARGECPSHSPAGPEGLMLASPG